MNKTAHDKLMEMGFVITGRYNMICYAHEFYNEQYIEIYINIKDVNYYLPDNECIDLELSKILTQYLVELEKK